MKRLLSSTIALLLIAVALGIAAGYCISEPIMKVVMVVKDLSGQVIFFLIPLIIFGFVASSIASLRGNVSRLIVVAFALAYVSSIGAAFLSMFAGWQIIPLLHIVPAADSLRPLPEVVFKVDIPPVLGVMSTLLLAVFIGLGVIWIKSKELTALLEQFRDIVLQLVKRILVPVLPLYVAANFCALSYQGNISQLWVFLPVLLIVIVGHYIWLLFLYVVASLYSGRNGWQVVRHYLPAYLTALGTMSSAATLGVALECAHKNDLVNPRIVDFGIPLFNNIHLCGSVLTETFFVCVVSQLLYGHLPAPEVMVQFILLLGVFAVGAPGVPGGTVLASLGIVISVLGFDDTGTALLITIFALQDSFGTACNVTGDAALTLIVDTYDRRHKYGQDN